jgi:hypothetical protein
MKATSDGSGKPNLVPQQYVEWMVLTQYSVVCVQRILMKLQGVLVGSRRTASSTPDDNIIINSCLLLSVT